MRRLGASVAFTALVGALAGCPAIAGLDDNYTSKGSDGGDLVDGALAGEGSAGSSGHGSGGSDGTGGSGGSSSSGGTRGSGGSGGSGASAGSGGNAGSGGSSGSKGSSGAGGSGGSGGVVIGDSGMCPPPCTLSGSAGWALVAYEASGSDPCPSGFTEADVVEPSDGGSCPCSGCTVTTEPDCYPPYPATISSMWNLTGSTCDGTGGYFLTNGGACETDAIGNAGYMSLLGPGPVAGSGACTSTALGSGPSTTAERVCTPTKCTSDACASSLGASFTTCLYQAGDQACPKSAANKHTVGTSAGVSCGGCDCSVSATGCSGEMAIYQSMSSCTGTPVIKMKTDGTCYAMPDGGTDTEGDSYAYTANPTGVSCNAGTSSATVNVSGQGTVCCP